jgi:ATP-dependent DNA helicase RecG
MELVWFQGIKWIQPMLAIGKEFLIYGKINVFNNKISLPHPELESNTSQDAISEVLMPIYSTTDPLNRAGFDMKFRRGLMESWMKSITPYQFPEMLPEALINHYKFPARIDAIRQMHFPKNLEEATRAKDRLIFEEFFINQASLMIQKLYRKNNIKGYVFGQIGHYFNTFYKDHLPFELTNAQKRVIKEIRIDSGSGFQLNRLAAR